MFCVLSKLLRNKLFIILFFIFGFLTLLSINDTSSAFYSFCDPLDNTAYYTVPDLPTDKINRDSENLFSFIVIGNDDKGDYFKLYDLIYNSSDVKGVWVYSNVHNGNSSLSVNNCSITVRHPTYAYNRFYCYSYKSYFGESTNTWIMDKYTPAASGWGFSCGSDIEERQLIYSNKDIHIGLINNGQAVGEEIFFQPPPQWGINLVQPLQVKQILPMVNKLTTILLPIGLAIFLMLLVVYLIASRKWFHI